MTNTEKSFTVTDTTAQVDEIQLRGRFSGAFAQHYRVAERNGAQVRLIPVRSVSHKNEDGTFSSRYEDVVE